MSCRSDASQSVVVGDSELRLTLSIDESGFREERFEVSGKLVPGLSAIGWALETDAGTIVPAHAAFESGKAESVNRAASVKGSVGDLDWKLDYQVLGSGMITKTLSLTPRRDVLLKQVSLWRCRGGAAPVVSSTSLQDIAAFFRQDARGMFVSLDFPYSRIVTAGGETSVTYPPFDRLRAGQAYICHSMTFGATTLTGRMRYGFDEGEVDAMDSYVQKRFAPRFNRPMLVSTCINNRYTMPKPDMNDGVFYTMKDHATLSYNHDLLKREIELMPKLGMEYYQLWTGPFDSVPGDPDPKFVDEIVRFGRRLGVRIGDYSSTNILFCYHYNDYKNTMENHPEWGLKSSDRCLGNPNYIKFYKDMVVASDRRYGFEIHCLDGLILQECKATDHGHPAGRDSLYAQVRGLVEVIEGLDGVSPEMMSWSNMGDWGEILPKIAWTNHNLYLTDPFIASPWQGLNMTRLLDDARREQMVSLHYSRFIPYRYLTNCQYFFCLNSVVPDIRNYQYGALSTIAVTPNLCLGEIRPWLDRLPAGQQTEVTGFYKKWTDFLKHNYGLWTKTYQVGENPGMGSVEIYGHAKADQGFVFLVNPQYWDRTVEVPLDASLGFTGRGRVEVSELYPVERLRLTDKGPFATLGSRIAVTVPAQTVVVLKIEPAPERIERPRLYGLPGTVEASKDGYLIKTRGQQGLTERCAVLLPDAGKPVASATVRDYPKQPKRSWAPTSVKLTAADGNGIAMDITFRRDAAPADLRDWRIRPGSLADGTAAGWTGGYESGNQVRFPVFVDVDADAVKLPLWDAEADRSGLGPLADFCGAYIDNAFSETQETWIDLKTGARTECPKGKLVATDLLPARSPLPADAKSPGRCWWAQTKFHLPFMYTCACEPFYDEHTLIVLPFVRQARLGQVKAWINGIELDVRRYQYPRNRSLSCFYADLVGSGARGGENTVVVYFDSK